MGGGVILITAAARRMSHTLTLRGFWGGCCSAAAEIRRIKERGLDGRAVKVGMDEKVPKDHKGRQKGKYHREEGRWGEK